MHSLQEAKDNWKAGLDESGHLKEGEKFYSTTKPQGVIKNLSIYKLIVETYLFPFDHSMVFNLGVKLMANKVTAKMRDICSYSTCYSSFSALEL